MVFYLQDREFACRTIASPESFDAATQSRRSSLFIRGSGGSLAGSDGRTRDHGRGSCGM